MRYRRYLGRIVAFLAFIDLVLSGWAFYGQRVIAYGPLYGKKLPPIGTFEAEVMSSRHSPSCEVVHYSSSVCHFCVGRYARGWLDLEKRLHDAGCTAVIISPDGDDMPLDGDTTPHINATVVSLQFADTTRIQRTPLTLLLDGQREVIWSHIGPIDSIAARQAMHLIGH